MSPSPETDALQKDLEQLRKDFKALSAELKSNSQNQVQAGISKAREQANSRFGDWCGEIESRPFTCITAAFGIGLLVGKVFSR